MFDIIDKFNDYVKGNITVLLLVFVCGNVIGTTLAYRSIATDCQILNQFRWDTVAFACTVNKSISK